MLLVESVGNERPANSQDNCGNLYWSLQPTDSKSEKGVVIYKGRRTCAQPVATIAIVFNIVTTLGYNHDGEFTIVDSGVEEIPEEAANFGRHVPPKGEHRAGHEAVNTTAR